MSKAELQALAELYQARDNDMVIEKITKFLEQTDQAAKEELDQETYIEFIGPVDDFVSRFIEALKEGEI
jgi:hypothetical protein